MHVHSSTTTEATQGSVSHWFHLWWLPVIWLLLIVPIWSIVTAMDLRGDKVLGAVLASLAGLWLAHLLPEPQGQLVFILAICVGGVLAMAAVGLVQDLLRVPRRVLWGYLAMPFISFTVVHILFGVFKEGGGPLLYIQLLLIHFCVSLYVFSLGSCVVCLLLLGWRQLVQRWRRTM